VTSAAGKRAKARHSNSSGEAGNAHLDCERPLAGSKPYCYRRLDTRRAQLLPPRDGVTMHEIWRRVDAMSILAVSAN
jgi:hypothetical protein